MSVDSAVMLRPDEVITIKENNVERHRNPKYCFSWSNYKSHMMDQMGELLRDEKFVDVTIFCENRFFKAHKLILCGASPFLKNILEENQCPNPVLSMAYIPWTHMTWILQFIYSGQVSVPEDNFPEFLETAKQLQISILCKKTGSKRFSTTRKSENCAKKPRVMEQSELPELHESQIISQPQQQSAFFRTEAIMAELQQATSAISHEIVHLVPEDPLDVQTTEEVVEIECTTEHTESFNPHDSYCIPRGPPDVSTSHPHEQGLSAAKHMLVFDSYQASTLKSSHSLAPKTCNMCGKVYSNLSNLRQHVNLVHTTNKSVQCPLCGKYFKSDLYMRRHVMCAHNVTPVRKDSINWREIKTEIQNTQNSSTDNVQQQMWPSISAAVASLNQNIQSTG